MKDLRPKDPVDTFAEHRYCASRSRFFWGLRLHLITTTTGLPPVFALTDAKADERDKVSSPEYCSEPSHSPPTTADPLEPTV